MKKICLFIAVLLFSVVSQPTIRADTVVSQIQSTGSIGFIEIIVPPTPPDLPNPSNPLPIKPIVPNPVNQVPQKTLPKTGAQKDELSWIGELILMGALCLWLNLKLLTFIKFIFNKIVFFQKEEKQL